MSGDIANLEPCATYHLDAYTAPASKFAFSTYDQWYSSPDSLTALDCLAANLLSLSLRGKHVIPLFATGNTDATRLKAAMQCVLEATTDADHLLRLPSVDSAPFTLVRQANAAVRGPCPSGPQ